MCRWISGLERCEVAGFSNIEKEPQRCKEAKLHGTQTPDVAGTIFEGKWNCMMLKLAFEPEHALEVEEITGHSNTRAKRPRKRPVWKRKKLQGTQTTISELFRFGRR